MKNFRNIMWLIAVLAIVMFAVANAQAAEPTFKSLQLHDIKAAFDKNGNEYVRALTPVSYKVGTHTVEEQVAVMFFGDTVEKAKNLKDGTYGLIVREDQYQGRLNYKVLKILDGKAAQ